jgi:hypothetical protein
MIRTSYMIIAGRFLAKVEMEMVKWIDKNEHAAKRKT